MSKPIYKTGEAYSEYPIAGDLKEALKNLRLWVLIARLDLKKKYRKTALGPWWIVISNSFFILLVSTIYSGLFKQEFFQYLSYVALGYVIWVFINDGIRDGGHVFTREYGVLSQMRLPYTGYIIKHMIIRVFALAHNLPIIIISLIPDPPGLISIVVATTGLLLLTAISFYYSIWMSIVTTRYADVSQIINNLMRVLFFVTPIVWSKDQIGDGWRSLLADINPLFHLIEIIRRPLIYGEYPWSSFAIAILILLVNVVLAEYCFRKYRKKIIYWAS